MPALKPPLGAQLNRGHPLATRLVGYWLCNEGAGGIVNDCAGSKYHGAITGATWVPGPMGPGLNLSGTAQFVNMGNVLDGNGVAQDWTIGVWFSRGAAQSDGSTLYGVLGKCASDGALGYYLAVYEGNIRAQFSYYSGSKTYTARVQGTATLPKGVPICGVATYTAATGIVSVYVNGVGGGGTPGVAAGIIIPNTYDLTLGARNEGGSNLWIGDVYAAAIWRRALLPSEVAQVYVDPWAMLRPARRPWLWVTSGGAEAQTATLSVAAATAAGYTVTPSPGAVTATLGVASTAAAAFGLTASPGAVTVTAGLANATGAGYTVTASPGAVTATVSLAQAIAAALAVSGKPGTVTVAPGVAAASAVAYAMVAKPLAVTATLAVANATAVGLEATASLPGGPQTATLDVAAAVARAYAASAYGPIAGLRDTLILIDTRDVLLIGDLRDVLRLADTRDNLTLH
jgi:hypothetical protein